MQVDATQYRFVYTSIKTIYKNEGFKAFFQGFNASLFGMIHVTIQFPLYELGKQKICIDESRPTGAELLYCSSVPKILASLFSYPHEVMRSRLYLQNKKKETRFIGL